MLKKIQFILSLCLLVLCVSSCAPVFKTTYTLEPPESAAGLSCLSICERSKNTCALSLIDSDDACLQKAKKSYLDYTKRLQDGLETKHRSLNSFVKSLECRPLKNGHCQEDYRACYKMCGGKVNAHQQCISGTCPEL